VWVPISVLAVVKADTFPE